LQTKELFDKLKDVKSSKGYTLSNGMQVLQAFGKPPQYYFLPRLTSLQSIPPPLEDNSAGNSLTQCPLHGTIDRSSCIRQGAAAEGSSPKLPRSPLDRTIDLMSCIIQGCVLEVVY